MFFLSGFFFVCLFIFHGVDKGKVLWIYEYMDFYMGGEFNKLLTNFRENTRSILLCLVCQCINILQR